MNYDVTVIGGGCSGMFAAIETASNNLSTVLVEKGGNFKNHLCYNYIKQTHNPHLSELACRKHICLHGIGGAALHFEANFDNYIPHQTRKDRNNISFLFSSSLTETLGGIENAKPLIEEVYQRLFSFGLQPGTDKTQTSCSSRKMPKNLSITSSGTISVPLSNIFKITGKLEKEVYRSGVEVLLEHSLIDINLDENGYTLVLKNKEEEKIIHSRNVILAIGKRTYSRLSLILNKLKVKHVFPETIELGVRIETSRFWLKDFLKKYQNPRIEYQDLKGNATRFFCFCDGGRMMQYFVDSDLEEILVIDGQHAHSSKGNKTNFSILSRVLVPKSMRSVDFAYQYACLFQNSDEKHLPVQLYRDFLNNQNSTLENIMRVQPTLDGLKPSNLKKVITKYEINIEKILTTFSQYLERDIPLDMIITGPVIEKFLSKIILEETMQSSQKRLYFVGDCSGNVSGIISGAVTGIRAGRSIVKGGKK